MPQMAPLSWLLLFMLFSLTLILFNLMNYFVYQHAAPTSSSVKSNLTNPLNWKW
uniref:ATP synthase F0 subunit 8 n=1 Tax=Leptophlebia marginata TaxID=551854 RepID=UPI001EE1298C|nr:ATP synthase F0 subunit 8 [Leptophlebia marginata]YP_010261362.1 ATP synthase F0 subunit 8 [Leptophlebia vespertina]UIB40256.1 ATP synthase F0 subunit 8 [Leptophlebia marginata]UIB40269.1 ATP synthase F0 subunit 8 [Leptophlebia vespertina]